MQRDLLIVCEWINSNFLAVSHEKFLTMWLGNGTDTPAYHILVVVSLGQVKKQMFLVPARFIF